MAGPRWCRRPPPSHLACRRSTAARLPRPGLRASWLPSLLERSIERVVEERGLRDRLLVIGTDQRKAARDGAQSGRLGSDVQLVEVGPVHDARERAERGILRQPLLDQRLKRAAALLVAVRVRRSWRVEAGGALGQLQLGDLFGRDEQEPGRRIEKATDQPCGRGAVDPDAPARRPLHFLRLLHGLSIRWAKSPAAPAAMITNGSGIFFAFQRSSSTTPQIAAVGASMIARRPRTIEAPAIAPAAAAVTPATNAFTRSFFDQRRTL